MASVRSTIVELCVFKRTKKGPLYLVLKRSSTERLYPDIWQIITGKLKEREKAAIAVLRELKEETGLLPKRLWVVPAVDSFFDPVGDAVELCPLFAAEVEATSVPTLSSEHREFVWAGMKQARKLLVWPGHKDAVKTVHDYIVAGREAGRLTELEPNAQKGK
ncbi:MAG TPA: NUDIX domain-containing protein [Bacteroidota bacterium]